MRQKRSRSRRMRRRRQTRKQRGGGKQLFQDAYVITLKETPERFQKVNAFAEAAGLRLNVWPGVIVTKELEKKLPELGVGTTNFRSRDGLRFNYGTIGAFLAFRGLLRHIYEKGLRTGGTLVFQDDVIIPPDFLAKLEAIQADVPSDWDMLYLDKVAVDGVLVKPHIMRLNKDMTATKNLGNWGFIVNNASIPRILHLYRFMIDTSDIQIMKFADEFNIYLAKPSIITRDEKVWRNSIIVNVDKNMTRSNRNAEAKEAVPKA